MTSGSPSTLFSGGSLAVDREMVPRRLAPGDHEETHPCAGDPDERDELDD